MTSAAGEPPSGSPDPTASRRADVTRFQAWAAGRHGAPADGGYAALHRWSVDELETFWQAVAEWFDVRFSTPYERVLGDRSMPGAQWFPGATLNYAEHALRTADDPPAPTTPRCSTSTRRHEPRPVSWAELRRQVGSLAAELRALGVRPGDRVSGYLPNIPAGRRRVPRHRRRRRGVDLLRARLRRPQRPRPLPAGRTRRPVHRRRLPLRRQGARPPRTPSPSSAANCPPCAPSSTSRSSAPPPPEGALEWSALTAARHRDRSSSRSPFDHPLWVLYSSGTTGLPKAIVQSQGGILLEHLKQLGLHCDLGPDDRFFWYTSTGWMMWNFLVSGLLTGTTVVLYDGSPGYPDTSAQWRVAERTGATLFGTSAAYVMACRKADVHPGRDHDLSPASSASPPPAPRSRPTASAGSTTSSPTGRPVDRLRQRRHRRVQLLRRRGTHPARPHRRAAGPLPRHRPPVLGPARASRSIGRGRRTRRDRPMPSMPVRFWNDPDGSRYHDSYFDMYPGRLAPRRLDHPHRPRLGRHPRPLRLHAQPAGRPHGLRRHLRGRRAAPRDPRVPRHRPRRAGRRLLDAAVRPPRRRAPRSTTTSATASSGPSASSSHRATCRTRSSRSPASRTPSPASASRSRSSASSRARPLQGGQPGLRRQPRTPPLLRGTRPHPEAAGLAP